VIKENIKIMIIIPIEILLIYILKSIIGYTRKMRKNKKVDFKISYVNKADSEEEISNEVNDMLNKIKEISLKKN
jgi:hypothetical protein